MRNDGRSHARPKRATQAPSAWWKLLAGLAAVLLLVCFVLFAPPTTSGGLTAYDRERLGSLPRRLRASSVEIGTALSNKLPVRGAAPESDDDEEARPTPANFRPISLMGGAGTRGDEVTDLPIDFDWESYVAYHPELQQAGIASRVQAEMHYRSVGGSRKWFHRRLQVFLRYTACTGLVNQLYSHIAALSLAIYLGAEVVLPPAAKRDSFANYFSVFKEQNEVVWSAAPLDSILDVQHLISYWGERGLRIHRPQGGGTFPDLTDPDGAFVTSALPSGTDPRCAARLGGVYARHYEMADLVERARRAVVERAEQVEAADPTARVERVVLDLPCTFFMLRSASNIRLVSEVAKSLRWSPTVQSLAARVMAGITASGDDSFNSVHLRMEKDARDWSTIMGGQAVVWTNYMDAMREAGFGKDRGLYIASGLLTYGASDELDHLVSLMREEGLCQRAHYKELYLPKAEIEGLNSEQKALLDLLVLAQGHSFVGFGSSTFSFYLREFRTLSGIPRSRSVLVDASVIGTDSLFADAGKVT